MTLCHILLEQRVGNTYIIIIIMSRCQHGFPWLSVAIRLHLPSLLVGLLPKRCEYNNKDEDNNPNTLNDKNHQATSQKFRQFIINFLSQCSTFVIGSQDSFLSIHCIFLGWLVVWVLWHINLCRLSNAKSIFIQIISSTLNNLV